MMAAAGTGVARRRFSPPRSRYLTKDASAAEIREALQRVTRGQAAIDPRSSSTFSTPSPPANPAHAPNPRRSSPTD